MKNLMHIIAAVKAVASLAFTALVMMVTVVTMLAGQDSIPVNYIWQIVFLSLIFGCLQLIAFSENSFKKVNTPIRMIFLGLSMFVVLVVFAIVFTWFPAGNIVNWLIFSGSYAAIFMISVLVLRTVFKLSGIRYNQMLAAYKANRGNE